MVDEPVRGPGGAEGERTARILLVDDVRALVDLMKHYLKRTTCRVESARDGAEALRICRKEAPDLMFLDASEPSMQGLEACRTLKADPRLRSIPVVIVASREQHAVCLAAGCDDVLAKPVAQQEFLASVRRFVALKERTEERIPSSVRVEFKTPAGSYAAYTKDLSPNGAFLKSRRPFVPGTRLSLTLHLGGGREPLRIEAEVRRLIEGAPGNPLIPGIGVRFLRISAEARRAIEDFIAARRLP